jgi:RNA polymerase sigma factor (sigma-70 family)
VSLPWSNLHAVHFFAEETYSIPRGPALIVRKAFSAGAGHMTRGPLGDVLHHLRGLLEPREEGTSSDGQLLERFARGREEACFAALVRRHGGMVLGVCRRILRDEQDAEDAFQATFLVLARKADSIRKRECVGGWLYGVAYRVAARALAGNLRRRACEQGAVPMSAGDPVAEVVWRELRPILDDELNRLPEKYRAPLVLCYLENQTQTQAARRLGCTKGTLSGRLARARDLLRRRLTRRGLMLPVGLLALALGEGASAAVPVALGRTTVQAAMLFGAGPAAAAGLTSGTVTSLVEGVLHAMWIAKLKTTAAVLLAVAVLGSGTAWFTRQALAGRAFGVAKRATKAPSQTARVRDRAEDDDELTRLKKENARLKEEVQALKRALEELKQGLGQATKRKPPRGEKANQARATSPDGRLVAVPAGQAIQVLDAQSGRILWKALGHQGKVTALTFSPDGKVLATGSADQSVRLWDVATGKELRRMQGHRAAVRSVRFSPDGKQLISQGKDKATLAWDLATGKIVTPGVEK